MLDTLKARGMYDNSVIVFSTDNGGPANGVNLNTACNYPLRGTKYTLWEGLYGSVYKSESVKANLHSYNKLTLNC